jgi:arylsulfatase A-like enzyme
MPTPPNLLIIMVDEWRHDSLGCLGHPAVRTPHLDALAARGTLLTDAFCASPLCVPSRVSTFTGQYVHRHRGVGNGMDHHIAPAQTSLLSVLKEAGYRIGLAGKNHTFDDEAMAAWFDVREEYTHWGKSHGEIRESDRQVDHYRRNDTRPLFRNFTPAGGMALLGEGLIPAPEPFPAEQCMTARIAEDGMRFITESRDAPFCLYYSFPDPHWPNVVCEPYYSMYDPASLTLEALDIAWETHPFKHFVQSRACGYDTYTVAERQRILATYYGQITFIDAAIGRLLTQLDALGLRENTLILFAADHGNFAGRYGLIGKTGGFYDALVRIPLILAGPQIPIGQHREAQVSNIDLMPTVLDYLGLAIPDTVQGGSFLPVITGDRQQHREAIFAEVGALTPPPPPRPIDGYDAYNHQRTEKDGWFWFVEYVSHGRSAMVRADGWKYCYYQGDCEELYDLAADPLECWNLAADPQCAARKETMKNRLLDWMLTAPVA